MRSHVLADATDLNGWSSRIESQAELPKLVRRLILATADVERIDFPAGDAVLMGGWDGQVVARAANMHVPLGASAWELGTSKGVKAKADKDYDKRKVDPLGLVPSETTYVFVTSRRWTSKRSWEETRRKERFWKDVLVRDAEDLEIWMELVPAVHMWFSARLGKDSTDAADLSSFWEDWSAETTPQSSPDLVIGGRELPAQAVRDWASGPPAPLSIRGDSAEEAMAFALAALYQLPDDQRDAVLSRGVVAKTPAGWARVVASDKPLLIVPLLSQHDAVKAVRAGHHVLTPLGREAPPTGSLALPRARREAQAEALEQMGLPRDQARTMAPVARRSILALRRRIATAQGRRVPAWAEPGASEAVIAALLAGAWDEEKEGDRASMEALGGKPYEVLQQELSVLANRSDPPIRRVGTVWRINSKEDAWALLAHLLTPLHLQRLEAVVQDVLGAVDPALDLPPDERWQAPIVGKKRPHSGHFMEGLADTIAIMAARDGSPPLSDGSSGERRASAIVRRLLHRANRDETGMVWSSVWTVLPLLAEAAPEAFLESVDVGLTGEAPVLRRMFLDDASMGFLAPTSPHTGLMWALEVLAWSADYLGRAAVLLAGLHRIDTSGQTGNSPMSSLMTIFTLWHPQTAATLDQRLAVIDAVRRREPEAAWRLMLSLEGDVGHYSHPPRWRDWRENEDVIVPPPERERAGVEVTRRLVEDAGHDPSRLAELVGIVDDLPSPARAQVIDALLALKPSSLRPEGRHTLCDRIREMVARHSRKTRAVWAMPKPDVDGLAKALARLEPRDPVWRYRWLFVDYPGRKVRDGGSWTRQEKLLEERWKRAVRAVHAKGGIDLLLTWSDSLELTEALGGTIGGGAVPVTDEDEEELLGGLGSGAPAREGLARGYVRGRLSLPGSQWIDLVLARLAGSWSANQRAAFLLALPRGKETWKRAADFGAATRRAYWSHFQVWGGLTDNDDHVEAARSLLKHGRPYAAIEIIGLYSSRSGKQAGPALTVRALEEAVRAAPPDSLGGSMFSHHVAKLLDGLEGKVDEERIALLELSYLPVLEHEPRSAKTLHRAMSRDPEFFAAVVAGVYRSSDEEDREPDEAEVARARLLRDLLRSWRLPPGTSDGGKEIDPEALQAWVMRARKVLASSGRVEAGDTYIGRVLRYAPPGTDGSWPPEVVRDIIEVVASRALENGLEIEVYNSRGTTMRGPYDGGGQERTLVDQYRAYAKVVGDGWPRTAAVLRSIANSFHSDAGRNDLEAELDEDT